MEAKQLSMDILLDVETYGEENEKSEVYKVSYIPGLLASTCLCTFEIAI